MYSQGCSVTTVLYLQGGKKKPQLFLDGPFRLLIPQSRYRIPHNTGKVVQSKICNFRLGAKQPGSLLTVLRVIPGHVRIFLYFTIMLLNMCWHLDQVPTGKTKHPSRKTFTEKLKNKMGQFFFSGTGTNLYFCVEFMLKLFMLVKVLHQKY